MTGKPRDEQRMRLLQATIAKSLLLASLGCALSPAVSASEQDYSGKLRLRHSHVDSRGADGDNSTALLRLKWDSKWSSQWQSTIELDAITELLPSSYNDGTQANSNAFIPDATGLYLKQLSLSYQTADFSITAGRQRLNWDNQRFLGSESFWQNDQVFDAISSSYKLASASALDYVYLHKQYRIFGEGNIAASGNTGANGNQTHQSHLVRLHWRDWDYQTLSAYYLKLDNETASAKNGSTTVINYKYDRRLAWAKPFVVASFAKQQLDQNQSNNDLYYRHLQLGTAYQQWQLSGQREVLSSNGSQAFSTPLASLHDFHGWADKWWNLPPKGIIDDSVRLLWRGKPVRVDLRWHHFKSHADRVDWGEEINLDILYKHGKHHRWLLRLADYHRDDATPVRFRDETRAFFSYQWMF